MLGCGSRKASAIGREYSQNLPISVGSVSSLACTLAQSRKQPDFPGPDASGASHRARHPKPQEVNVVGARISSGTRVAQLVQGSTEDSA